MRNVFRVDDWLRQNKNMLEGKDLKTLADLALDAGYSRLAVAEFVYQLSRKIRNRLEPKISQADRDFVEFERKYLLEHLDK